MTKRANQIERDVYVLSNKTKTPINYVRLTNEIPIVFTFRDYDIPDGATANVFVQKPSGSAVYGDAAVSGNTVTVAVTTQMFAELGTEQLQLRVADGDNVLVSFSQPVNVFPNYTEGDATASTNEGGFFSEWERISAEIYETVEKAQEASEKASTAADSVELLLSQQQQLFEEWFQTVKDQLSEDAAGNLQLQCMELDGRLTLLEYMTMQNDFSAPIATDDEDITLIIDDLDYAILADWKHQEV